MDLEYSSVFDEKMNLDGDSGDKNVKIFLEKSLSLIFRTRRSIINVL